MAEAGAATGGDAGRLRLLFVLPFAPDRLGSHGGARVAGEIIALLAARHEVAVLYLAPAGEAEPRALPEGGRMTAVHVAAAERRTAGLAGRAGRLVRLLAGGRPDWAEEADRPEMAEALAREVRAFRPDILHCECAVMEPLIAVARGEDPAITCIVTDYEPGISADAAPGTGQSWRRRLGNLVRRRAWARLGRRILDGADAVVAFTPGDVVTIRSVAPNSPTPIVCIPFRLPLPPSGDGGGPAPISSDLLFVGNFNHPPNRDAALFLLDSILPRVRAALPDTTLAIVGADPPPELNRVGLPGVTVTGWVENPGRYLAGTKVVVAPLRQGGGMRVKVVEACAFGKPVVATACATAGLDLAEGTEFFGAEDAEGFARAIVSLLSDPDRRVRMGQASRNWAERTQSPESWRRCYAVLYARLGHRSAAAIEG